MAHHKRNSKIYNLNEDRERTLKDENFENNPKLQWEEALLANKITHLERLNSSNRQAKTTAKISTQGEKLGTTWANLSKTMKPKPNINRLLIPNVDQHHFKTNSKRMAELAKNYHELLQTKDTHQFHNKNERKTADDEVLQQIPAYQKLTNADETTLHMGITNKEVEKALKTAKNGSATGLDGCPYELWKTLHKRYKKAKNKKKPGFNIIKTLTIVFQDIQNHGVDT
jgi:hypothetical protein